MTPEEETQLIDKLTVRLSEKFLLIPKSRFWHFLGGATTFAVAAFALSFAGVLAGMKSTAAVEAEGRIKAIRQEVEEHRGALQIGSYIRSGDSISLLPFNDQKEALVGFTGSDNVAIREYTKMQQSEHTWIVKRQ